MRRPGLRKRSPGSAEGRPEGESRMILQLSDAASESNCRLIRDVFDSVDPVGEPRLNGGFPCLLWSDLKGIRAARKVLRTLVRTSLEAIRRGLRDDANLQADGAIVTKLVPRDRIPKHADNCRKNPHGNWIPNHTRWREVSAVYYLNSEFEGGEIVFEQHETVIKPRMGLLVLFPSDQDHLHEVLPVRSGSRYCLQLFFTADSKRANPDIAGPRWRSTVSRIVERAGGFR